MKHLRFVILLGSMAALQACSHGGVDKRIDEKLAQGNAIQSQSDLHAEASHLIENAPGLSDVQRSQLVSLRESMKQQMADLQNQSLQLRSVLLQGVMAKDYDAHEIDHLKKRIRAVENKRVSVLFSSIEKANTILGRQAATHRSIVKSFVEHGHPSHWD